MLSLTQQGFLPALHPLELAAVMTLTIGFGLLAAFVDDWFRRRTARRKAEKLYRDLTRTNIELYAALAELKARGQVEHEMALWIHDQLSEQQILLKELHPLVWQPAKEAA